VAQDSIVMMPSEYWSRCWDPRPWSAPWKNLIFSLEAISTTFSNYLYGFLRMPGLWSELGHVAC